MKTLNPVRLPIAGKQPPKATNYGKGRGGRPWRRLKNQIHQRDQYTCQACGLVTLDLQCDHIINTAAGGTDDPDNLQSLCKPCHDIKTQREAQAGQFGWPVGGI